MPLTAAALQSRIDQCGLGRFQALMLLLTGGIMCTEGAEMLVMGSITTLLHDHWDLTAVVRGTMVSIVFIGFSVGNLCSGLVGDNLGRRPSVLLSYVMIGTFGLATGASWSPSGMILLRFFVGVGCGIGFPSVYSLIPEVCPTEYRGMMSSILIGFMPLGELYAAFLVLAIDPNLEHSSEHCELGWDSRLHECSWRMLCMYSAVPAFLFFAAALLFLYESPHFLASKGKHAKAEQVLATIERWHGGGSASTPEPEPKHEEKEDEGRPMIESIKIMIGRKYVSTTMFLCLCHFTKDFVVFGFAYVFPQFFRGQRHMSTAAHLIITALLAFPGVFLAIAIMRVPSIGHITALRVAAGCCAVTALGMLEVFPDVLAVPCAYLSKFLSLMYFIITVIYTAEVFPSTIRNTAVGVCTAVGRLGSISAPLLFEVSSEWSGGSFDIFMGWVILLMATVASAAGVCLTMETKGQALVLDHGDASPKKGYGTLKG